MSRLILASASPRRRELLLSHGAVFEVRPTDTEECRPAGMSAWHLVRYLAEEKAKACLASVRAAAPTFDLAADDLILAADTVVEAPDGEILGKPTGREDALRMLHLLSGAVHRVWSGAALFSGDGQTQISAVEGTQIAFRLLSDSEIASYVAGGEPMDKAGAYAIQGGGGNFVQAIEGDFENVVGLPVGLVETLLKNKFGKKLSDFGK